MCLFFISVFSLWCVGCFNEWTNISRKTKKTFSTKSSSHQHNQFYETVYVSWEIKMCVECGIKYFSTTDNKREQGNKTSDDGGI